MAVKAQCVQGVWADGFEYRRLCYNDIQALWHARELGAGRIPYVEQFLEYPTLTGTVMWLTARVGSSDAAYFWTNSALLGLTALATTAALYRARPDRPARVLLFAASPALAFYAVLNWDLLAVLPLAAGLWWWRERRVAAAGAAFGVGAAAKLFPAAALVAGAVELLRTRQPRRLVPFAAAFAVAWSLWNVPYLLAGFDGWLRTWTFHAGRFPDYGTVWYWVWELAGQPDFHAYGDLVDQVSLALLVAAGVLVVTLAWRRRLPLGATTGMLLAAFLVLSKVHSPQYALWLLPVFVVVPGTLGPYVAYIAADAVLFVAGFRWIATPGFPGGNAWRAAFALAVFARAAALVWAGARFARAQPPQPAPASPPPMVDSARIRAEPTIEHGQKGAVGGEAGQA